MQIENGSNKIEEIIPYLLHWYDYNRRILPWRESPTPYHVWVSEIMLQQTRVEAVKGYFDRFITELPDIKDLAEADEEKLLKKENSNSFKTIHIYRLCRKDILK